MKKTIEDIAKLMLHAAVKAFANTIADERTVWNEDDLFIPEHLPRTSLLYLAGNDDIQYCMSLPAEDERSTGAIDAFHELALELSETEDYGYKGLYEAVLRWLEKKPAGIVDEESLDEVLELILTIDYQETLPDDDRFHDFIRKLYSIHDHRTFVLTWLHVHDELIMLLMENRLKTMTS